MNRFIRALFASLVIIVSPLVFADVVVVVNASSSLTSVKKSDLGRVFLGKSSEIPGAGKVVPINQIMASKAREEFDSTMLNRSPSQMKSYWSRQLFSGEGTPPAEVNGDIDMLKRIAAEKGAIGYLDPAAVNDAVKVVKVTD